MLRSTVSAELILHIAAGYIGAFLAFPLAVSARKGSPWHRIAGRLFVVSFLVICITGYILNWDELMNLPLFRPWSDPGGTPGLYEVGSSLAFRQLIVAGTGAVNTFALYLAVSGWRVWSRRKAVIANQPQHLDQLLAMVELIACAVFAIAFWQLIPMISRSLWLRIPMLLVVAVPAADALNDLHQASQGLAPKHWWLQHLRKLSMAEAGLLAAVALRCAPPAYVAISMLLSVVIVVLPTILIARHQLQKHHAD